MIDDDYIIVTGSSHVDLSERVNEMIDKGYIPIGGIAINELMYFQSVIREEVK